LGPIFVSCLFLVAYVYLKVKSAFSKRVSPAQVKVMEGYTAPEDLLAKFTPGEVAAFKRMYYKYDADGSGAIDREELGLVYKEFDESASDETINKLFSDANLDGDDDISFAEFLMMMSASRHDGEANEFASLADKVREGSSVDDDAC